MAKKKTHKGSHPLANISEEMKQWSAMLGAELENWPKVSSKPMFGMTAYYTGEQIFAVLPKTKSFGASNGIGFRFEEISDKLAQELKKDARVISNPIGKQWITFVIEEPKDVNAAIGYLMRAAEGRSRSAKSNVAKSKIAKLKVAKSKIAGKRKTVK